MDTRISSKTSVVVAIIAVMAAVLWAPPVAASDDITEYPIPTADSGPGAITAGPDGNIWFTEVTANKIGRISPTGTITEFQLPPADRGPLDSGPVGAGLEGIAAGPDGNIWFTEMNGNAIGRITPTGSITEFQLPPADRSGGAWRAWAGLEGIAAGPDGNLWFTEFQGNAIGRITPDGTITEYPFPKTPNGITPGGIAAGPDGNMWFTEYQGKAIGRITPAGAFSKYLIPTRSSFPGGITAGPDGNMWFTEGLGNAIGRITPAGTITEYRLPEARVAVRPGDITAGPDGNLWFTEGNANKIGRISPNATPRVVTRECPVRVTLHSPAPTKTGSRVFTDRISTKKSACVLRKPVVRVAWLKPSTGDAKKPVFNTKVSKRGKIRVITKGHEGLSVTVIVRAYPKIDSIDRYKRGTWRKSWILR